MDNLRELIITIYRMHSGCSFQNVLDTAEAHALLGHALLDTALAVVVVDGGRGGEAPESNAGRIGVILVRNA